MHDSTSTSDLTFSNVPAVPMDSLPLLSKAEKKEMTGVEEEGPRGWSKPGQPLCWQEMKSRKLWQAIIANFKAGYVVDLSPGSGALGLACMEQEVKYLGFCSSEKHRHWLDNVFTKESMVWISKSGHTLYQQTLADLIALHWNEVIADADMADADAPGGDDAEEPEEEDPEAIADE